MNLVKALKFRSLGLLLAAGLCMAQTGWAESELIHSVTLEQPQGKIKAELWGETLKGGYNKDLLIMLKDEDGKLVSAYNPDVTGGYNPYLQSVKLMGEDKEKQLLLAVGEGNWKAPTSYRLYNVHDPEKVKELFTDRENLGVVDEAHLEGENLKIRLQSGQDVNVSMLKELLPEKIKGNGLLDFQKIHSLTVYGGNSNGKDILFIDQQM
ncbi:MAG: hypothetical protein MJ157_06510 [Clostridia bacterium]|nr:hypothetical protein [Clostridia bacterium]